MKRVPDFIFFLLSLAAVAVSPVAASVIYRQFFHTDWSLTLRNIVIHELKDIPLQLITLGCLFAGIMIAYVLTGANRTNSDVKSIRTIKVTDKIRIPVPAGDGQYGNARFLTKKEIRQKYTITDRENLPNVKQVVALLDYKKKLDITTLRRKENFTIMTNDGHVLIVGGTRSGKTRRELLENIALSIDAGNNNVVMDVKGELYAYTSGYAEQHGVEKPIVIDFVNPLRSTRYNYMQTINAAVDAANAEEGEVKDYSAAEEATLDLVSILVKESRGLDPLWYNGECAAIAAAIMCVAMEAPKEQRNLTTVYWFLGEMTEVNPDGEIKLTDYLKNLPGDHPAKKLFMMARSSPSKTRGSFFSSALGTLSLFANDMVAYMTSQDDFDLTKLDEKRQIIYIIVPDEKKKYHPLASLLMAQLTIALAESARQNGGRCKYSWIFRWDEFGNSPKRSEHGVLCIHDGRTGDFI